WRPRSSPSVAEGTRHAPQPGPHAGGRANPGQAPPPRLPGADGGRGAGRGDPGPQEAGAGRRRPLDGSHPAGPPPPGPGGGAGAAEAGPHAAGRGEGWLTIAIPADTAAWSDRLAATLARYDEALLRKVASRLVKPRNFWPVEDLITRCVDTANNPVMLDRRLA